jgi:excisionase family DNA binding protein
MTASAWADPKPDAFLTAEEVAERWRLSKMTVYRMIESGELTANVFSRTYRIPLSAVLQVEKESVFVPEQESAG